MIIKINILNKRIQIKQIVREITFILQFHCPCSYPVGTLSQISYEVTFLDFPGQITIDIFKQNLHSEMI